LKAFPSLQLEDQKILRSVFLNLFSIILTIWLKAVEPSNAGLHSSGRSKGQIDQHKFAAGSRCLFCCSLEEIL